MYPKGESGRCTLRYKDEVEYWDEEVRIYDKWILTRFDTTVGMPWQIDYKFIWTYDSPCFENLAWAYLE